MIYSFFRYYTMKKINVEIHGYEGMKNPVCMGIHAAFAGNAYTKLKAGAGYVITCNTRPMLQMVTI